MIADLCQARFVKAGWEVERRQHGPAEDEEQLGDLVVGRVEGAGRTRVLMIGHMDTVFDPGTVARRPFRIEGDRALGPGVTDMKGGLLTGHLARFSTLQTINGLIALVAGAISMLAQFGFFFGAAGGDRDRGGLGIIGVLLSVILAPLAAMLIQMTISRTREYSADRMGGEICGNPLWLASALGKISGAARRIELPTAERDPASAHLFIVNPLSGARMDNLFSTHPATENRIAALMKLAQEMGKSQPSRQAEPVVESRREPAGPWDQPRQRRGPWS